jgi:hypothetical protein
MLCVSTYLFLYACFGTFIQVHTICFGEEVSFAERSAARWGLVLPTEYAYNLTVSLQVSLHVKSWTGIKLKDAC